MQKTFFNPGFHSICTQENVGVEIKIPVSKNDFSKALLEVRKNGKLLKTVKHVDDYFNPPDRDFLGPTYPTETLSIRRRNGTALLNYKRIVPDNYFEAPYSQVFVQEFDTEIGDAARLAKTFSALGFKHLARVEKKRTAFKLGDAVVCFDEVRGLGFFIEPGFVGKTRSTEAAKKSLAKLAEKLGLKTFKPEIFGYPLLMLEKKGLWKRP